MSNPPRKPVIWLAQSWWVDEIYAGAAYAAMRLGYTIDANMRHMRERVAAPADTAGVVLYGGDSESLVRQVAAMGVPVVSIDPYEKHPGWPKVVWDDREIGRAAALHLAARNPERLVFVDGGSRSPIPLTRLAGFREGGELAGLPPVVVPWNAFDPREQADNGRFGVFAGNDAYAIRLMERCLAAGLRIPEDVMIVGADDDPIACEIQPVPLSSVNPGRHARGVKAVEVLDRLIRGVRPDADTVVLPIAGVTERASTRLHASGDADLDRLIRHFRENAHRPVGIDTLCEECGVPVRRALHLVKTRLGTTPFILLRDARLRLAARFERAGKLTAEAVARRSGFGSALTHRRARQAAVRKTPGAPPSTRNPTP